MADKEHKERRQDEHVARVRDYGEADAATYEQRVREGAAAVPEPIPDNAITTEELDRYFERFDSEHAGAAESTKANNAIFADMMRDISNPPRLEELKKFEVWHADRLPVGDEVLSFPGAFTQVDVIEAHSLMHAIKTSDEEREWKENHGVTGGGYRPTQIGDVVVDPEGKAHRFDEQGFHEVVRSDYERQLQESIEINKGRGHEKGKGRER